MFPLRRASFLRHLNSRFVPIILLCAIAVSAPAATIYNEALSGDLSNNGLTPTILPVSLGSNQILGATGGGANGIDRDYFTITVPAGLQVSSLFELGGTQVGGGLSFIGLQSGPQFTLPTNATTANGLLGWDHYGPTAVDIDILPPMSVSQLGSSGFNAPLQSGQYSFWIQDFNTGTFSYAFDVRLTATPEPATYAGTVGALVLIAALAWQRRHTAAK